MQAKNQRRQKHIHIRASETELTTIKEKARTAGLRLSDYLRHAGVTATITQPIPEAVTKSISGFGRNLNQCAYHCNATGKAEVQAIEALRQEVKRLVQMLQARRN